MDLVGFLHTDPHVMAIKEHNVFVSGNNMLREVILTQFGLKRVCAVSVLKLYNWMTFTPDSTDLSVSSHSDINSIIHGTVAHTLVIQTSA
jgi:hypothetical protein